MAEDVPSGEASPSLTARTGKLQLSAHCARVAAWLSGRPSSRVRFTDGEMALGTLLRSGGETGKRYRLKICWEQSLVGSIPTRSMELVPHPST